MDGENKNFLEQITAETLNPTKGLQLEGVLYERGQFIRFSSLGKTIDIPTNWSVFKDFPKNKKIIISAFNDNDYFLVILNKFFECDVFSVSFELSGDRVLLDVNPSSYDQELADAA